MNYFFILKLAYKGNVFDDIIPLLSSIREQLFHHFKARIDAMFVDDII